MTLHCLPCLAVLVSAIFTASTASADAVEFNRDIRPILSENCFACHGPDPSSRAADLRLDQRDAAVDYGAIVPQSPGTSLIMERLLADDPDLRMPPPETGKTISAEQRELIRQWVAEGAEYQTHWAFVPIPRQVPVPGQVVIPHSGDGDSWARSAMDEFVFAELQERGLQPAAEADRSDWLRRVSFDLIGLPPTITQIDAFLADRSPQAYERVVDRLLQSNHYGQRMANMWLDVARYADTFGYQNDIEMDVWPWRDWVIEAFNDNLPYDQFVIQQTAGDLLPQATTRQRLATTFNRLHRQTNEGGSIPEEFRQAIIADRTATNATAFLGLTFECSRCHDHKYDPILQKDFYSLAAYFSNIDELGLYSHFTHTAPTPAMLLFEGDQQARYEATSLQIQDCQAELQEATERSIAYWKDHPELLIDSLPEPPTPDFALPLEGQQPGVVGKATLCDGDEAIVFADPPEYGRHDPVSFSLWVKPAVQTPRMMVLHQSRAAEDAAFRGLQLVIDDGHPEFSLIHFWPGNAIRIAAKPTVAAEPTIAVDQWSLLTVAYDGTGVAAGVNLYVNGELVDVVVGRDQLTRDINHRADWGDSNAGQIELSLGARFRDIGFRDGLLDDLQIFNRQISSAEVAAIYNQVRGDQSAVPLRPDGKLQHQIQLHDAAVSAAQQKLLLALRERNQLVSNVRQIMTMQTAAVARETFILNRGSYDAPGQRVTAETPEFLYSLPSQPADRLGLARWMTDRQNPLVSRVIANRLWHLFFGRGIVASLEDFGSQGSPPSHPQLLDFLASELISDEWDLKSFCRRIVLSATYRQSSTPKDPSDFATDPANIWLARGPKHRLSAEQVRDAALAASGLLVDKLGGPSVMPYQPAGLWEEAGTGKSYKQATGDGLYRRSLYTFWRRTSPPPSMLTFDATSRETCTAKRELTTTPLQALVLLNDPQYVEAARVLAEQLLVNHPSKLEARWNEAALRLMTRRTSAAEQQILNELYEEQKRMFADQPDNAVKWLGVGRRPINESLDAIDLAATAVVVGALISYDETMMKR